MVFYIPRLFFRILDCTQDCRGTQVQGSRDITNINTGYKIDLPDGIHHKNAFGKCSSSVVYY